MSTMHQSRLWKMWSTTVFIRGGFCCLFGVCASGIMDCTKKGKLLDNDGYSGVSIMFMRKLDIKHDRAPILRGCFFQPLLLCYVKILHTTATARYDCRVSSFKSASFWHTE
jgi:hypothetical protein